MQNILIIGGGGFIGTNLSLKLREYFNVFLVNRLNNNTSELLKFENIHMLSSNVDGITSDQLRSKNFHSIIWLLHNTIPASNNDLNVDIQSDLFPLINFINLIKSINYTNDFLYFSSGGTIYGNPDLKLPIPEDSICAPISQYGFSKQIAELSLRFLSLDSKFHISIIRPSNVYGIYQNLNRSQGIIGHAFNCIVSKKPLILFDDGSIERDFIHIDDLSAFILKLLNSKKNSLYEIYNIGSGQSTKLKSLIDLIVDISHYNIDIVLENPRKFDCEYNVLDINKSMNIDNWEPLIDLKSGLENYWGWFKNFNYAK
jgi:UDP-glucose 4-epimerase